MKPHELRAIRHMALGMAEQLTALLELLDSAMPTDDGTATEEVPKEVQSASEALEQQHPTFGAGRRAAAAAPPADPAATGTDGPQA